MLARLSADGLLHLPGRTLRATLGRAGITPHKQEGDGATPAGLLPLRRVLYRADRLPPPATHLPLEPIAPTDGWCDDPASPCYNRPVSLPFAASHEQLWRPDALYDVIGVLGWNDAPPLPGQGSAIFLHVATPDRAPTAGCIALPLPDLLAALADGLSAIEVAG